MLYEINRGEFSSSYVVLSFESTITLNSAFSDSPAKKRSSYAFT